MQTWSPDSRTRISSTSIHDIIRRKVWEARIPVNITICDDELHKNLSADQVSSFNYKTRPFFTLAPRTSYFPLLLSQLRRHYDSIFTSLERTLGTLTPWLEWKGQPLDWHHPIGHLFDECYYQTDEDEGDLLIPWTFTLHFTDYPSSLLPSFGWHSEEGGGALGMHFYAMLKQADFTRYGSPKGVNNLGKSEQSQLWDGVWTHSFERFWRVNSKLVGSEDSQSTWKGFPIRLYIRNSEHKMRRILQAPISPRSCSTLKDAVEKLIPEMEIGSITLYSHGVKLPLDASLNWLSLYFIFPDGFLHIIIACNK
jgi:autophagy-related protein 5